MRQLVTSEQDEITANDRCRENAANRVTGSGDGTGFLHRWHLSKARRGLRDKAGSCPLEGVYFLSLTYSGGG